MEASFVTTGGATSYSRLGNGLRDEAGMWSIGRALALEQ